MPAKAGIQEYQVVVKALDPGFRRHDSLKATGETGMDCTELDTETIRQRIQAEGLRRRDSLLGRRLEQAKLQQEQIEDLGGRLAESEADRAARFDQIVELTRLLKESEADRAARLEVIRGADDNIKRLHALLDEERKRADDCEQGWRALEDALAVRLARKIGLVRTCRYERRGQQAAGD